MLYHFLEIALAILIVGALLQFLPVLAGTLFVPALLLYGVAREIVRLPLTLSLVVGRSAIHARAALARRDWKGAFLASQDGATAVAFIGVAGFLIWYLPQRRPAAGDSLLLQWLSGG
jgi:hypothetical protein